MLGVSKDKLAYKFLFPNPIVVLNNMHNEMIMQIALYTVSNWAKIVMENVWSLIGRTAPPEYIAKLTYLTWNHDKEIKHIDTVRAYSFGCNYFVEVDIVLPEKHIILGKPSKRSLKFSQKLREHLFMWILRPHISQSTG